MWRGDDVYHDLETNCIKSKVAIFQEMTRGKITWVRVKEAKLEQLDQSPYS